MGGRVESPGSRRLALIAALLSSGCGAAASSPEVPARPGAPAPLVRVSVQSRRHQTLQLGDRVPGFDRLSFSAPSAALYDEKRDVYAQEVNAATYVTT